MAKKKYIIELEFNEDMEDCDLYDDTNDRYHCRVTLSQCGGNFKKRPEHCPLREVDEHNVTEIENMERAFESAQRFIKVANNRLRKMIYE